MIVITFGAGLVVPTLTNNRYTFWDVQVNTFPWSEVESFVQYLTALQDQVETICSLGPAEALQEVREDLENLPRGSIVNIFSVNYFIIFLCTKYLMAENNGCNIFIIGCNLISGSSGPRFAFRYERPLCPQWTDRQRDCKGCTLRRLSTTKSN